MSLFGTSEVCRNDGCGHPMSDHVSDRIMHEHQWRTVHRCVACERDGGACTDGKSILADLVPQDESA